MSASDGFHVVFVCTGNRCRSPYAAVVLESLTGGLPVTVSSEGTLDAPGHTSPPELVDIAAGRRLELEHHRARPIGPGSLSDADLVIGFSFHHVAGSVIDGGADRSVTFTLPELVRLLVEAEPAEDLPPIERAREMLRRADELRDSAMPSREEVADPFGGPRRAYETMANEIDDAIEAIVEKLFGPGTLG